MALTIRIRELRQQRGLTLAELAGMVGISTPHLSQVERGVKNLNNHLLERLSKALGVEPYELIAGGAPEGSTLDEICADLPPEDRARVEAFARNLRATRVPPQS
jgi:transcriptional regulator with XRE-family HTH domain